MFKQNNFFTINNSFYISLLIHALFIILLTLLMSQKKDRVFIEIPIEIMQLPAQEQTQKPAPKQEKKEAAKPIKKIEETKPEKKIIPVEPKETIKKPEQITEEPKQETKPEPIDKTEQIEQTEELPKDNTRERTRTQNATQQTTTFKPSVKVDNFPYMYYLKIMQQKIVQNWDTTNVSQSLTAIIYFKIDKQGNIADIKVGKTSSNTFYDDQALRAVTLANPLPPLPYEYKEQYLEVYFGFEYKT